MIACLMPYHTSSCPCSDFQISNVGWNSSVWTYAVRLHLLLLLMMSVSRSRRKRLMYKMLRCWWRRHFSAKCLLKLIDHYYLVLVDSCCNEGMDGKGTGELIKKLTLTKGPWIFWALWLLGNQFPPARHCIRNTAANITKSIQAKKMVEIWAYKIKA